MDKGSSEELVPTAEDLDFVVDDDVVEYEDDVDDEDVASEEEYAFSDGL